MKCANCHGIGRIPTVRSFARVLLGKLYETTSKRTLVKSIIMELPVDPAVYLLNEKRDQLAEFEANFNCELIILPRTNLQMPDYNLRIDKLRGKRDQQEDSFALKPIKGIEHGAYLNDPKPTRRPMPSAITSFKPRHEPPPATLAAQAHLSTSSNGSTFSKWLLGLFSKKTQASNDKVSDARRSRKRKQSSKGSGSRSSSKGEAASADGSSTTKRNRKRSQRRSNKSGSRTSETATATGNVSGEAAARSPSQRRNETKPSSKPAEASGEATARSPSQRRNETKPSSKPAEASGEATARSPSQRRNETKPSSKPAEASEQPTPLETTRKRQRAPQGERFAPQTAKISETAALPSSTAKATVGNPDNPPKQTAYTPPRAGNKPVSQQPKPPADS